MDFEAGTVRLEPGTTKNREARMFYFTDELCPLLEDQRAKTDAIQREKARIVPYVFHRRGKPIRDFKDAWNTACKAAGCPGRILHDLRRTAVRNMVRRGIPDTVAMQLSGHKTRKVFDRYNITSGRDLQAAAAMLSGLLSGPNGPDRAQLRAQTRLNAASGQRDPS